MIDEVAAREPPEKKHASGSTLDATDICWIKIHFLHGVDFFSDILRYIGVGGGDKIHKFARILINFSKFF